MTDRFVNWLRNYANPSERYPEDCEMLAAIADELEMRLAQIKGMTIRIHDAERERREYLQVLSAIAEANGGEIHIDDRAMMMFERNPTIESWKDDCNRQVVIRVVKQVEQ